MIREIAVGNIATIRKAIDAGVERVELSADLSVGGLTPTLEDTKTALALTNTAGIDLVVMVRPRAGDFNYSTNELNVMRDTLKNFRQLGVKYVTFGAVDSQGHLDRCSMVKLIEAAQPMQVIFHMAFDEIPHDYQEQSIQWLSRHNVIRILTHGGPLSVDIQKTLPHLQQLIDWANNQLTILPGGGIDYKNGNDITQTLNVSEIHGSRIVNY